MRRLLISALVAGAAVVTPAAAASEPDVRNRLSNPGAEAGLDGWTAGGFDVASYGADPTVPSTDFAVRGNLGQRLFRGLEDGATLTQAVAFDDQAPAIDAGAFPLSARALLGGATGTTDGVAVRVQPLDAEGRAIGVPLKLGAPTGQDRGGRTEMVECVQRTVAPVGMRSAAVSLTATGTTGTADGLVVTSDLAESGIGPPTVPGQGTNCRIRSITPSPPAPEPPSPAQPSAPVTPDSPAQSSRTPAATKPRLVAASVRLRHRSVRLRPRVVGRLNITVARYSMPRRRWTHRLRLRLIASSADVHPHGVLSRRIARLPAGRYRITVTGPRGSRPVVRTSNLR
jgi:hypothetical protein